LFPADGGARVFPRAGARRFLLKIPAWRNPATARKPAWKRAWFWASLNLLQKYCEPMRTLTRAYKLCHCEGALATAAIFNVARQDCRATLKLPRNDRRDALIEPRSKPGVLRARRRRARREWLQYLRVAPRRSIRPSRIF